MKKLILKNNGLDPEHYIFPPLERPPRFNWEYCIIMKNSVHREPFHVPVWLLIENKITSNVEPINQLINNQRSKLDQTMSGYACKKTIVIVVR